MSLWYAVVVIPCAMTFTLLIWLFFCWLITYMCPERAAEIIESAGKWAPRMLRPRRGRSDGDSTGAGV